MAVFPSPNHSSRDGHPVRAIVIHTTAGYWPSDRDYLCNPNPPNGRPVSSHEIIAPDGTPVQLVHPDRASWANGILNKPNRRNPIVKAWADTPWDGDVGLPNLETYTIEVSGISHAAWTSAQWHALRRRARLAMERYGLTQKACILRHGDIDGVDRRNCPMPAGPLWDSLVNELLLVGPPSTDPLLDAEYARMGGNPVLGGHVKKGRLNRRLAWVSFDQDVLICQNGVVSVSPEMTDLAQRILMGDACTYLETAGALIPYKEAD
jgi:hypothetical protein